MENIALAFSGGGFRAAAYSLGCLSYLNHLKYNGKPLLEQVKFISSTSGGSITNLVYSVYVYEGGKEFKDFYNFLFRQLSGEDLLAASLNNLNNANAWKERPDKSQNIINAFSLEYDKMFEGRRFELFSNRHNQPHLEEICINSTEFTNGYAFRFQSQHPDAGFPNGEVGNFYTQFKDDGLTIAGKLKLADILACSSCFPSGFEPVMFPQDFTYVHSDCKLDSGTLQTAIRHEVNHYTLPADNYNNTDSFLKGKEPMGSGACFGIMDGGVADNQAIDAFILADDRRKDKGLKQFDLFISCDVCSYFMDGYTMPNAKKKWYAGISLRTAFISLVIFISLLALWLPFSLVYFRNNWQWWHTVLAVLTFPFFAGPVIWLGSKLFKKKKKKAETTWTSTFGKYKKIFTRLGLGKIETMLLTRAKSVFVLANDVYLKQIRRNYYDFLFGNPAYRNRTIQNTIYDLSKAKFPDGPDTKEPVPSQQMIDVAEGARMMGTTLWFDETHEKEHRKEKIIATGQFTTCYNLLRYIQKKEKDGLANGTPLSPAYLALKAQLEADWKSFCNEPMKFPEDKPIL